MPVAIPILPHGGVNLLAKTKNLSIAIIRNHEKK